MPLRMEGGTPSRDTAAAVSQEDVELARSALDAFHRRDRAAFIGLCDPYYEWVPPADWPETAAIRGPEAVWAFLIELDEPWEAGEYEIAELIDCENGSVVMHVRRRVRGKTSGVEAEFDYWHVGASRNGKALRSEWFGDRQGALEAAARGA
jgi:ketosteroid isomerase-like protein